MAPHFCAQLQLGFVQHRQRLALAPGGIHIEDPVQPSASSPNVRARRRRDGAAAPDHNGPCSLGARPWLISRSAPTGGSGIPVDQLLCWTCVTRSLGHDLIEAVASQIWALSKLVRRNPGAGPA